MNTLAISIKKKPDNQNNQLAILHLPVSYSKTSLEEKVTLLLTQDLIRIGWRLKTNTNQSFELAAPPIYSKEVVRQAMAYSRNELLEQNWAWIQDHIDLVRSNLARGSEVLKSKIIPRIEVCETKEQNSLFRFFRYYWSSPSSDYVGRRMRLLIRDDGLEGSPIIGIAAIGSSIIHISERDTWIGWDIKTRTKNLINIMDAYVVGALPPYNELLGGKLMAYVLASNELRSLYKKKYAKKVTIIKKRKGSDLVLLSTTSLYGSNSSQYGRIKFGKSLLYKPIGLTSGYGSLHISKGTFEAMRELVAVNGWDISNKFGMGPNWRMRIIRSACDILELDSDVILQHSFKRGLFVVPLATNYKSFLNDKSKKPIYRNLPLSKLTKYWQNRWLSMRKKNPEIIKKVNNFLPENFNIEKTIISE
jgi:hypothetical protein